MHIDNFDAVSDSEALINGEELPIKRIIAVNNGTYWQSFVYLETTPKAATGIYVRDPERDAAEVSRWGYISEEYGLYKEHQISRAEYDDGSAVLEGKPCLITGAQLRVRYLSPYNLLIASKASPINNSKFDEQFEVLMNAILTEKATVNDLITEVLKLPKSLYPR